MATKRTGGIAAWSAQREFREVARRVERGEVALEEAMGLARGLPPVVLGEIVLFQRLGKGRYRGENLRILRGHLEQLAARGRTRRLERHRRRLDKALLALRDPARRIRPSQWVRQFLDVEDAILAELALCAARQARHPAAKAPSPFSRPRALEVLAEVARCILQLDLPFVSASAPKASRGGEQLLLPFGRP